MWGGSQGRFAIHDLFLSKKNRLVVDIILKINQIIPTIIFCKHKSTCISIFVKGVVHVVFQVSCYVESYTQRYFRDISSAYSFT